MYILTELEVVSEEKDLGVWSTYDLKSSLHCHKAAGKVSQVLSLIRRSFRINSVEMFFFCIRCMFGHIWNIVCKFGVPTWLGTYTFFFAKQGIEIRLFELTFIRQIG